MKGSILDAKKCTNSHNNDTMKKSMFLKLSPLLLLIYMTLGIHSLSFAQQPTGTYNVKTDGSALGDGITDDTSAINNAISAASTAGQDVYFPPGNYLISGNILVLDGVSTYGDKTGLSVIYADGSFPFFGDTTWGNSVDNINIEDLIFVNVKVWFKGGAYKDTYAIKRCMFIACDSVAEDNEQVAWEYIKDGSIEDSIFLRQDNCQGVALSTYKTTDTDVRNNIWGLDLNNKDWLATEWSRFSQWSNLLNKLDTLRTSYQLDWDQGRFRSAWYPNRTTNTSCYYNIFNGSPFFNPSYTFSNQDHVVYAKDFTSIKIIGNWMRGWPNDPSGGLKLRNADGPGVVAANYFVNTPVLQYTYDQADVPLGYKNVLVYRNVFFLDGDLSFNRLGASYWETTAPAAGMDINIEYHDNIYDCPSGIGNINISNGNTVEQKVYPTNHYLGTSTLIPGKQQWGTFTYTSGAPPTASTSPYVSETIPMLDIPEYGQVSLLNENFDGANVTSLEAKGWGFSNQSGAELVSNTSNSDVLGSNKSYLRIGGSFASQPYAEKSFTPSKNGRLKLTTFTTSSYSGASVRLQDSDGNPLFTLRMQTPTSIYIEDVNNNFTQSPMNAGASHDLLSSGSGITQLTLDWNDQTVIWRVVNKDADSGNVLYDTGFQSCNFGNAGIPSKIRLDTSSHNHTARYFGVTDLRITTIPALYENFSGETVATLKGQGWIFSNQSGAELVSSTSNSDVLGTNKSYLRIGGSFGSQPYAQKDFAATKNGFMEITTFTSSSYSNAAIHLQNISGDNLFTLRMGTPTSIYIEDIGNGFTKNPMDNSATHNLLSNGNSISKLSLHWDRLNSSISWRLVNRNADTNAIIYDTGWQTDTLNGTGDPSRIRLDTGTYNHAARYFGITDLIISNSG